MVLEDYWSEWSKKELKNYRLQKQKGTETPKRKYLKKGYIHFDKRIWFPDKIGSIKNRISDPNNVKSNNFYPFIKVIVKTPRYRYDEEQQDRCIDYKDRPICYASHLDSLIYGFYSHLLTRKFENYIIKHSLSECVLAYRSDLKLNNIDFAREVFNYVKGKGECTAICLDLKGFFDNIDHSFLKDKWREVIGLSELPDDHYKLYRSLTKFSYINKTSLLKNLNINLNKIKRQPASYLDLIPGDKHSEKFDYLRNANLVVYNPNDFGIPQGSPMSAVLSNIFMIDYDRILFENSIQTGFFYRRYCDDIIIICESDQADEIKSIAYNEIAKYPPLKIQKTKEDIILFKKNSMGIIRAFNKNKIDKTKSDILDSDEFKYYKRLQYLGFEFDGQRIFLRSSSLSRYFRRLKSRVSKTVKMAYSAKGKGTKIFKQKLFERYTHLGKRNFIRYALNASSNTYKVNKGKEFRFGLNSPSIRKQIARHMVILMTDLDRKNEHRITQKKRKGKLKRIKSI